MTTAQLIYLFKRVSTLEKSKEVKRSSQDLTGPVVGCYKLGYNDISGALFYRDHNNIWQPIVSGGGGVNSLGIVGTSPNVNGATITGSVFNLQPASVTFPGVVTTGLQTFSGQKTFIDTVVTNNSFKSIDIVGAQNATAEFTADLPAAAYPIGILKIGGSNGYIASARFMVAPDVGPGVSRASSLLIATNPNDNDSAQQNLYLTVDDISGIARIATYMRGGQIPGGYPIVFAPQGNEKLRLPITGNVSITTPLQEVVLEYVDNAAALAASLPIGTHYRTGDLLKIVH